ncbi:8-oxo-dGTP diphosphatase MutT [uncultured Cedecea sp.]|uniref:8-oxo-dGTP diphosphatase MutT n=1 Tax=uncultured Cedecea sp. TaxID=988762 RepID=UPI00261A3A40|nr:8-oxo-dGTP diphosphatase MutT [uncultured Cedecea sp.]
MKKLRIAAGIIQNAQGNIFITQRTADMHMADKWEFPGGKLEAGETAAQALVRELQEEIGIDATEFQPFETVEYSLPDRHLILSFFLVREWTGDPWGKEGQPGRWVKPSELIAEQFPPANVSVIEKLRQNND